jgi:hypothetical protein
LAWAAWFGEPKLCTTIRSVSSVMPRLMVPLLLLPTVTLSSVAVTRSPRTWASAAPAASTSEMRPILVI